MIITRMANKSLHKYQKPRTKKLQTLLFHNHLKNQDQVSVKCKGDRYLDPDPTAV